MDERNFSYINTELKKINFDSYDSFSGEIVRKDDITFNIKKEDESNINRIEVIINSNLVSTDNSSIEIISMQMISNFETEDSIDLKTINDEPGLRNYFVTPSLSEISLLIGVLTSKAFNVPMITPPMEINNIDETK